MAGLSKRGRDPSINIYKHTNIYKYNAHSYGSAPIYAKSKSLGKMTLEGVEVKWEKKGKVMGSKMAILHDIPERNRLSRA